MERGQNGSFASQLRHRDRHANADRQHLVAGRVERAAQPCWRCFPPQSCPYGILNYGLGLPILSRDCLPPLATTPWRRCRNTGSVCVRRFRVQPFWSRGLIGDRLFKPRVLGPGIFLKSLCLDLLVGRLRLLTLVVTPCTRFNLPSMATAFAGSTLAMAASAWGHCSAVRGKFRMVREQGRPCDLRTLTRGFA